MAKKVEKLVKLQIPAGKATPSSTGWTSTWSSRYQHHGDSLKSLMLVQLTKLE